MASAPPRVPVTAQPMASGSTSESMAKTGNSRSTIREDKGREWTEDDGRGEHLLEHRLRLARGVAFGWGGKASPRIRRARPASLQHVGVGRHLRMAALSSRMHRCPSIVVGSAINDQL